jgi:hypothetical protein
MYALLYKFGLQNYDIFGDWDAQRICWKDNYIVYDSLLCSYIYADKYN